MNNITQAELAQAWGVSQPYISKLVRQGMPLTSLEDASEWRALRAQKPPRASIPEGFEIDDGEEDGPFAPLPVTLGDDFFNGTGALAAIERLNKAEVERSAAYFDAIKHKRGHTAVTNAFKLWIAIIEALRKLAKDEPEIRKLNDLTVDKSDMEANTAAIFAAFCTAAKTLPRRAGAKVFAARDLNEIVAILEVEMEGLFRCFTDITARSVEAGVPVPVPDDADGQDDTEGDE